jgi:hypothetical protein
MTQEEIIEMVKQTDLLGIIDSQYYENELWIPDVVEFAKLIAEKEREACAKMCESASSTGIWLDQMSFKHTKNFCAYAIRTRGQE